MHREEKLLITIKKYVKAESLRQAYDLNQIRTNRMIGGMLWMKMGNKKVHTAIDISEVVSRTIEETSDTFTIGAMTCLHDVELHQGLNRYTGGAVKESLCHIVGIQFRNGATVGGSIYGRFGFSDLLTIFMALDCHVELYQGGIVPLEDYVRMPYDRDIILNIIIKKVPVRVAYQSVRNTKTDFPVLTCAAAYIEEELRVVVGARPQKAVVIHTGEMTVDVQLNPERFAEFIAQKVTNGILVGGNMRASADYRRHLVGILTKRMCRKVLEQGGELTC